MSGFQPDPPLTYLDVLDQIAASGYAGTELGDWGFMPDDPLVLRPELERRGLSMIGAFTPVELTDPAAYPEAESTALRAARLLAACSSADSEPGPYVILAADASRHPDRRQAAGRVKLKDGLSEPEWEALTRGANAIARAVLDETGVRTVFHPHCGTPVETMAETKRLAEATDPLLVGLCFDTGHVAYAGDDPAAWLAAFAERIRLVHFKDMDSRVAQDSRKKEWDYGCAVRSGLFTELGNGDVNFRSVHKELVKSGYEGWIVVEDEIPPGLVPPFEAAKRDREFLRGLGL